MAAYAPMISHAIPTLVLLFAIYSCGGEVEQVTTKTATASPLAQGREHFLADRYSEAITAFEAALADSSGDFGVHRQLGRAHLALGRYDTAQSYI